MLDRAFWVTIGDKISTAWKKWTFVDGKDVYGKKFGKYSTSYSKAKKSGGLKRQATQYKNTTLPILTSDLRDDLKVVGTTNDSVQVGWVGFGERIEHLASMGRVISEDKQLIPKPIDDMFNEFVSKEIDKKLGPDETKIIRV
jgi:hypothetical protein